MNGILFVVLISVLVVHGYVRDYKPTYKNKCENHCNNEIYAVFNKTDTLRNEKIDLTNQIQKLTNLENMDKQIEDKFDLQTEDINRKFEALRMATVTTLEQIKSQDEKIQQHLQNLHKLMGQQSPIAGPPYQLIGSKYYYIEETQKLSWFHALHKCLRMGGHLVSIKNWDELSAIKEQLQDDEDYWIDTNDINNEGKFISIATGREPTYLNWIYKEPNNLDGKEDCVELHHYGGHQMNDDRCSKKQLFICEPRNQLESNL